MAAPSRDANSLFRSGARSAEMLAQINWASLAMLRASGILSSEVCVELAEGMRQLEGQPDHARTAPADYLDYETLLAAQVGAKASLLHLGRSRQDIAATISHAAVTSFTRRSSTSICPSYSARLRRSWALASTRQTSGPRPRVCGSTWNTM